MFATPSNGLTVLVGLAAAVLIHRLVYSKRQKLPLPPGPKGIPILGNVKDLPTPGMLECHFWAKHKDLYGPLSSLTVLGQTFIIINDSQIALELLRDRAATTSGRPRLTFACDLVGWKDAVGFCSVDAFKLHRKNFARQMGASAIQSVFIRAQEEEAAHFLLNVLDSPDDLFDHMRKEAGAVMLKIVYGYNVEPRGSDYLVDLVGRAMHTLNEVGPGRWAVDILPFLQHMPSWLPGTGFKTKARAWAAELTQTANQPYAFVAQQMRQKQHKTCFLSEATASNTASDPYMEYINRWSAFSMYAGGADTTVSSLMTFFLAMTLSLAVFNIEKAVDESGNGVEPEAKFEAGVVSHPVLYKTAVTPRSERHRELVQKAGEEYPWEKSDAQALETVKW